MSCAGVLGPRGRWERLASVPHGFGEVGSRVSFVEAAGEHPQEAVGGSRL
jgi:hypothetical protein